MSNPLIAKLQSSFVQSPSAQASDPAGSQDTKDKLAVLEKVLDEVEAEQKAQQQGSVAAALTGDPVPPKVPPLVADPSVLTQALPMAVDQVAKDSLLNPAHPTGTAKESSEIGGSTGASPVEAGAAIQYVEQEKVPEIPVEVESYLQKVDDHQEDIQHEVVIADGTQESGDVAYPSRPVVVLPIDESTEQKARFKGVTYSIKWLVEFSHKIIKMFAGKVIYRKVE